MDLSAAIIAGGHSRRMGRDKALLPHPVHGTWIGRQLQLLAELEPREILVSCRGDQTLPLPAGVRCVHDDGTQGPLAGLAAVLDASRHSHVLVVGVDLGQLTARLLRQLIAARADGTGPGIVPRSSHGFEPLAAVYPTKLAGFARARLAAGGDLSLRGFVAAALATGDLIPFDVPSTDLGQLANWNTPADLPDPAQGR